LIINSVTVAFYKTLIKCKEKIMPLLIKKQSCFYQAILLFIFSLGLSFSVQAEEIVTEPIRTFEGHTDTIVSVAFSPDGQTALTGSYDNLILQV